ncbi:hypothetical protein LZQ00_08785 [Sphingobacterium sp. SRCM116780]|uniref:hypothetical protein n=1 Tax=Sphingobacterium sp. SRCM116780 TaxID=2907623 RepID=UPI001F3B5A26|nr:hypothetical protein [Sphingobacterium sp. SRCM116780]UIR57902.1 hypothetical protein LZQ00_08785 [Sphingobacterium sp. SRCM116780]
MMQIFKINVYSVFGCFACLFFSCTGIAEKNATKVETSSKDTLVRALVVKDTSKEIVMDTAGCVFSNDIKGDTEKAIFAFNKGLKINWNKDHTRASVYLDNDDQLELSIGGCDHYSYDAYLKTAINYRDQSAGLGGAYFLWTRVWKRLSGYCCK